MKSPHKGLPRSTGSRRSVLDEPVAGPQPAKGGDVAGEMAGDVADPSNEDVLARSARDYERIADALAYLGESWRDQPSYGEAARRAGLSPHYFHRMFVRWTGTTPKRYVGALAHDAARRALGEGQSLFDAAYDSGLSGPSRLHDLFIAHEAVTPGQAKQRGEGLAFIWGAAPTPFGTAVFLESPRGLSGLAFAPDDDVTAAFDDLWSRFPAADFVREDARAHVWARRIFLEGGPTPLALYGTPWQRQVWRALIELAPGSTTSYHAIAETIAAPKASRAVGAAVGRNPIAYLIPCHRVLAADGRLTGYHWGVRRKRAMLAWEAAHAERSA